MAKHTLRATLTNPPKGREARRPDTPMVGAGSLIVSHKGEMREAITVRTYYASRGSGMQPVRACIWIRPAESGAEWLSGRGSAGGCGYHKESAAIADAVSACGVQLWGKPSRYMFRDLEVDMKASFDFGGTGDSAYEEIFSAIARAAGYRGRMIWVSHSL